VASALFIIATLLFVTSPLLSGKKERKKKVMGCKRGCYERSGGH
jgi:hypothetical protein